MTGVRREDTRAVIDAAALGIGGPVIETTKPREADGRGAHRTGFERDMEIAGREADLA